MIYLESDLNEDNIIECSECGCIFDMFEFDSCPSCEFNDENEDELFFKIEFV